MYGSLTDWSDMRVLVYMHMQRDEQHTRTRSYIRIPSIDWICPLSFVSSALNLVSMMKIESHSGYVSRHFYHQQIAYVRMPCYNIILHLNTSAQLLLWYSTNRYDDRRKGRRATKKYCNTIIKCFPIRFLQWQGYVLRWSLDAGGWVLVGSTELRDPELVPQIGNYKGKVMQTDSIRNFINIIYSNVW